MEGSRYTQGSRGEGWYHGAPAPAPAAPAAPAAASEPEAAASATEAEAAAAPKAGSVSIDFGTAGAGAAAAAAGADEVDEVRDWRDDDGFDDDDEAGRLLFARVMTVVAPAGRPAELGGQFSSGSTGVLHNAQRL